MAFSPITNGNLKSAEVRDMDENLRRNGRRLRLRQLSRHRSKDRGNRLGGESLMSWDLG